MDRTARTLRPDAHDRTPSPRTSSFVEAISDGFGRSGGATAMASTSSERQRLERLAQYSPRHRDVLRNLTQRDAEARTDRRLLEWCANFSPRCETRLRDLARHDARRDGWLPSEALAEALSSRSWDPSKHPRGGYPENPGRWSPAAGGGSKSSTSSERSSRDDSENLLAFADTEREDAVAAAARKGEKVYDHSDAYYPSEKKGWWRGEKGQSDFMLKKPVVLKDKRVTRIRFVDTVPDLKPHAIGESPFIIVTGDNDLDQLHAKIAWQKLNPGETIPSGTTFHHDALAAVRTKVPIGEQEIEGIVGRMQLVPIEINQAVMHGGSASIANRWYDRLRGRNIPIDMKAIRAAAKEQAALAKIATSAVREIAAGIKAGQVDDSVRPLMGRAKKVFFLGPGLMLLTFPQDVKAHGLPGAIARATPVLGEIISAYDLGTELAQEIIDKADAKETKERKLHSNRVKAAWIVARQQTVAAYRELAPSIAVTNPTVDDAQIGKVMTVYRNTMQQLNWLQSEQAINYDDYTAGAKRAKDQLKRGLIDEAQRNDSPSPRMIY